VRRTVLHSALWLAAEAAGVKLVHGELGEVTQDAESVNAAGFRARYLAAADGLHSPIRKALGLSMRGRGPAPVGDPSAFRDRRAGGQIRSRCTWIAEARRQSM
jgi:2-polyprenyl-6-methoxyphenol hydroxylase-like FAD-dependent oxidoreductase